MFACRAVDLDFFNTAPIRVTVEAKVARPPSEVFAALAHDPANWGEFFPGFDKTGRFDTPGPHGVGSRRTVRFTVIKAEETILAWDEGARWAFRVDSVLAPVFHAFAEDYRVEPVGTDATRLRWTMACEPRLAFKLARPFLRPVLTLILARAGHNLERGRWYSTPINNSASPINNSERIEG
jgi:carbon monoxide dehydrogenase subunit G